MTNHIFLIREGSSLYKSSMSQYVGIEQEIILWMTLLNMINIFQTLCQQLGTIGYLKLSI